MKIILILLFCLFSIKCQVQFLEYYNNYTFISPSPGDINTYFFYPHYEVGTVNFIIYFSESKLSCVFDVYDGDNLIDSFKTFYTLNLSHVLKIPKYNPKPNILRLEVTNLHYNLPYYLYFYNNNYNIQIIPSNYYLYQLSLNNLEINYEIPLYSRDIFIKFQSIIEFPEFNDNIDLIFNDGDIEHKFNEKSSYYEILLKKDNKYKFKLKCNLFSKFTNETMIMIYLEENEKNYYSLLYSNINTFKTIFPTNKIYFIDNINLIDGYNFYKFNLTEIYGTTNLEGLRFSVCIKRYSTYDIDYIKNNTPINDQDYDEVFFYEKKNIIEIKTLNDEKKNYKMILVYQIIDYVYQLNPLYEYSIQKIQERKEIKFPQLVTWYTQYEFSPLNTDSNNIILISTNHSDTIYPITSKNTRNFTPFYNRLLYISFTEKNQGNYKLLIKYDDEKALTKDENDMGYFEGLILDDKYDSLELININNNFENIIFFLELQKNNEKYYYLKFDSNNDNEYYLYNEQIDAYSYLTIKEMPVNILQFSYNKTDDRIKLMDRNNEYIFKIGYTKDRYQLVKIYLIKNEKANSLDISEGQIKMFTFPKNKTKINLDIDLNSKYLSNKTFISLKLLSDKEDETLYIEYNKEIYLLNNSGTNLFYVKDYSINLDIVNNDTINDSIPILVKFPLCYDNINLVDAKSKYELNSGQIGMCQVEKDKTIRMKLKSDKSNFVVYYYFDYLPEDYLNNTNDVLLSPDIFNKKEFTTEAIDFELLTELDIDKIKTGENKNFDILNKETKYNLYFIFSFNERVIINEEDENINEEIKIIIIIIVSILVPILIAVPILYYFLIYKKKKKIKMVENEETPFNDDITLGYNNSKEEGYQKPIEDNYPSIDEFKTIGNDNASNKIINDSNNISIDNNADLPAPFPA